MSDYKGVNLDKFYDQLVKHEGYRNQPYKDTLGNWTVGVGHLITSSDNIPVDSTLTDEQVVNLANTDMKNAVDGAKRVFENAGGDWDSLPESQKHNLANLSFNMGPTKLAGFKNFMGSMVEGDYSKAAENLADSKWYGQVGNRGPELVSAVASSSDVKLVEISKNKKNRIFDNAVKTKTASRTTNVSSGGNQVKFVNGTFYTDPEENVLNSYDLVSYHIKFSIISENSYKLAATGNEKKNFNAVSKEKIVICESGVTSFSIESLVIENVIGVNGKSGTSTGTKISMQLVEPYGASLVDRCYAASKKLGISNHLKTPYLLEVWFAGRNIETGQQIDFIPEAGLHQWFIMITNVDAQVENAGTTYNIEAVNYTDLPGYSEYASLEQQFNVTSKNTLQECLTAFAEAVNKAQFEKIVRLGAKQAKPDRYEIVVDSTYPDVMKGYSKVDLAETKINLEELYKSIRNDETISNKRFFNKDNVEITDLSQFNDKDNSISDLLVSFNDNTEIPTMIESIIAGTEWAKEEALRSNDPRNTGDADTPIKTLFKVYTDVELLEYDYLRNDYARLYRYIVRPYCMSTVYARLDDIKFTPATRAAIIYKNGLIKRIYKYIHTGENTEIIDFNLKYNFSWYAALPNSETVSYVVTNPGEIMSVEKLTEEQNNLMNQINGNINLLADPVKVDAPTRGRPSKTPEQKLEDIKTSGLNLLNKKENLTESEKKQYADLLKTSGIAINTKVLTESDDASFRQIVTSTTTRTIEAQGLSRRYTEIKKQQNSSGPLTSQYLQDLDILKSNEEKNLPISWKIIKQDGILKDGVETDPNPGRDYFNSLFSQAISPKLSKITLNIKGDPYWLSNVIHPGNDANPVDLVQSFFYLSVRLPSDPTGDYFEKIANLGTAPTIEGLYSPLISVNRFERGVFTQELNAVKDVEVAKKEIEEMLRVLNKKEQKSIAESKTVEKENFVEANKKNNNLEYKFAANVTPPNFTPPARGPFE